MHFKLTVHDIVKVTRGTLVQGSSTGIVKKVCINSRLVRSSDAFVAIKGQRLNGHKFVSKAIAQGAKIIIVSQHVKCPSSVTVIKVKDTTRALGQVAAFYRQQFDIPIIAITGSAGKTTTKEIVADVLSSRFCVLKNDKSENNQYGVPLTLLKLKPKHTMAVLELGTNQSGDIRGLAKMVQPDVAIFTNVGESHLQGLKNTAGVFREKVSLLKELSPNGTIVVNADDAHLRKIKKLKRTQSIVKYGVKSKAHVRAENIQCGSRGHLTFSVSGKKFKLRDPVWHNISNALAAICCGQLFKISYNSINTKINKIKGQHGRLSIHRIGGLSIIDDTYNANPISYRSAIHVLDAFPAKGKKVLVCADMLELGVASKTLHQQIGHEIAQNNIDVVLTFGDHAKYLAKAIHTKNNKMTVFHCDDRRALHRRLKTYCCVGDVVLVKGSRGMHMEKTVNYVSLLI